MSLSNPNKPVTEQRLQEFYHKIEPYMGGGGGTGGGGHTIEDSEGTALTQRDTLQFGDGLNASDDSENEKTVVEPNLMTAADMDDVVTPLPSVQSRYQKFSTEEQIVGEWIDGSTIYQKTFILSNITMPSTKTQQQYELMNTSTHDVDLISGNGLVISDGAYGGRQLIPTCSLNQSSGGLYWNCEVRQKPAASEARQTIFLLVANASGGDIGNITIYVTVQYTKTT